MATGAFVVSVAVVGMVLGVPIPIGLAVVVVWSPNANVGLRCFLCVVEG